MLNFLIRYIGKLYIKKICAQEYNNQSFNGINERPIELSFLFRNLVNFWPQNVLDIGTGTTALPHIMYNCGFQVTAIDNIEDYWGKGVTNRHYHVINDDITKTKLETTFDAITCISVLEHIQDHRSAIQAIHKLLRPKGLLILTFPYSEKCYVPNVYLLKDSGVKETYKFVTQSFSRKEIDLWLEDSPFEIIKQEYWKFFDGDFWTCGNRIIPPMPAGRLEHHQLTCLALKKL